MHDATLPLRPAAWARARCLGLALAAACLVLGPGHTAGAATPVAAEGRSQADAGPTAPERHVPDSPPRRAHFGSEQASADTRHVAHWAVHSGDHRGMPFVIVDKAAARVFVFDAKGRLLGAAPALIGSAQGDDSVPGIGDRKLSTILPHERTTPAGRFVAALARSLSGEEILWVDYDSAIALHRVIATAPKERRLQRLESRLPQDRRITYGCINVPVRFYETVVSPALARAGGIVYVLPETRPLREVFGSYDLP